MAGIGFFAPLPLAMMLPFMAGQSMIMGDAFGKAYQYGKRKISAMSNEEFNKMDANTLGRELLEDYTQIIPHLKIAVQQSKEFQSLIIRELVEIVKNLPKDISEGAVGQNDLFQQFLQFVLGGGLPQAFGDTGDGGGNGGGANLTDTDKKFVTDYLAEARALPFKLLEDIVEKLLSGKLPNTTLEKRLAYIQVYKERLPEKKNGDTDEAIEDSGATGDVKKIATLFAALAAKLDEVRRLRNKLAAGGFVGAAGREKVMLLIQQKSKVFLQLASAYNRFVQGIGKANLSIDTAKSLAAGKIIPKS